MIRNNKLLVERLLFLQENHQNLQREYSKTIEENERLNCQIKLIPQMNECANVTRSSITETTTSLKPRSRSSSTSSNRKEKCRFFVDLSHFNQKPQKLLTIEDKSNIPKPFIHQETPIFRIPDYRTSKLEYEFWAELQLDSLIEKGIHSLCRIEINTSPGGALVNDRLLSQL